MQSEATYSYSGFPVSHVQFLRCNYDDSELETTKVSSGLPGFIKDGFLRCLSCSREYPIINGIVRMLELQQLDAESMHELQMRDKQIEDQTDSYKDFYEDFLGELRNMLEVKSTLAALNLYKGCALMELACGTGRYTTIFATKCRALVAVDFSLQSLLCLAKKIPPGSQAGLVQADITRLSVAPQSFDRIFSTTSLDSREQRMSMHHLAADALNEVGRYVFSAEFYDLRSRLLGLPRARRYTPGGMYYCHMERDDILRETAPFFRRVHLRPMTVVVPFSGRFGRRSQLIISRIAERIPFVRNLGELLLVYAKAPIRSPEEGQYTAGNKLFKAIYRWYSNRRGPESKAVSG